MLNECVFILKYLIHICNEYIYFKKIQKILIGNMEKDLLSSSGLRLVGPWRGNFLGLTGLVCKNPESLSCFHVPVRTGSSLEKACKNVCDIYLSQYKRNERKI